MNHRYLPDPILLGLTAWNRPPLDADIRADFVRLALSKFAGRRRYDRLGLVVFSAGIDALKAILLVMTAWDSMEADGYERAAKTAAPAMNDPEFIRLAELCADVLQWETDDPKAEFETYAVRAWPVLCDEIEYEEERVDREDDWEDLRDPYDYVRCAEDWHREMAQADRRYEEWPSRGPRSSTTGR